MKELREEIFNIKEEIYSCNIEKRKLNEKVYSLSENNKKMEEGYRYYKGLSDKVDNIKSIKDVKEFKNINLKTRIEGRKSNTTKKEVNCKSSDSLPTSEYIAETEIKEDFNKLHYNDKTTLENKKEYLTSECKELLQKTKTGATISLFAELKDNNKYEIEAGNCETMLKCFATVEQLKSQNKDCKDLVVLELKKNSHYIPMLVQNDKYCALVGGDVSVIYKEKINTGSEMINVWHIKK